MLTLLKNSNLLLHFCEFFAVFHLKTAILSILYFSFCNSSNFACCIAEWSDVFTYCFKFQLCRGTQDNSIVSPKLLLSTISQLLLLSTSFSPFLTSTTISGTSNWGRNACVLQGWIFDIHCDVLQSTRESTLIVIQVDVLQGLKCLGDEPTIGRYLRLLNYFSLNLLCCCEIFLIYFFS